MNIDYYGHPRCTTSKAAEKELKSLGIDMRFIDLTQEAPSPSQLESWMEEGDWPVKAFFNTSGIKYRELGLKDKVPTMTVAEAAQLLATDGMLIKRPLLVRDGTLLQIGYRTPYADLKL
ncbi:MULTISPECIES: Spx/MgsR family RNA polymerase-binding regulatory protein [unclassified Streptococcus]|uniref:Spx/MgsR family RNA polymerase-binding regulatory protein n=1 Tax=unclassified Streptococcus TaxID=2608887 RepID=UPI0010723F12|nr:MULTISPECIES: Spx/MgsR family RNA polymerase-binding regulatory protein [unclassified Streptococcus]MBF0806014.1 Spx/MgsR family RNA polymerase-binding regulatory protein [Streptococcus sp. 19428wA2_WM07]TFU28418.1 Spx/MgsR family RNA polymerase-binding regulatory protein [Streptococcus sp. WM07]